MLKESTIHDNTRNEIAPQSCVIAMESLEECSNVISSQKALRNEKQEAKRKLVPGVKEVEMQHEIGETNFTTPPTSSKLLKHSTNLGSEVDPNALSSHSPTVKMKNDMSTVPNRKLSPEEKNSLQSNHP